MIAFLLIFILLFFFIQAERFEHSVLLKSRVYNYTEFSKSVYNVKIVINRGHNDIPHRSDISNPSS